VLLLTKNIKFKKGKLILKFISLFKIFNIKWLNGKQ
jgi:hypothetical protein